MPSHYHMTSTDTLTNGSMFAGPDMNIQMFCAIQQCSRQLE